MDESQRWVEFGRWLTEQRQGMGLRRREAARRARISEAAWRDLETGRKVTVGESSGGIRLLPNVGTDVLERVASALEVPMEEVLKHVGRLPGRHSDHADTPSSRLSLVQKISRLPYRDRRLVERLVDGMIEED